MMPAATPASARPPPPSHEGQDVKALMWLPLSSTGEPPLRPDHRVPRAPRADRRKTGCQAAAQAAWSCADRARRYAGGLRDAGQSASFLVEATYLAGLTVQSERAFRTSHTGVALVEV